MPRTIASVLKQSGCEVPDYMLRLKQDAGRRRRLTSRAPRRDGISTVLQRKRKPDPSEGNEAKANDTEAISSGKNNKNRKLQQEKREKKTGPFKAKNKADGKDFKDRNNSNKQNNQEKKQFSKKKTFVHNKVKNVKSKVGKK